MIIKINGSCSKKIYIYYPHSILDFKYIADIWYLKCYYLTDT